MNLSTPFIQVGKAANTLAQFNINQARIKLLDKEITLLGLTPKRISRYEKLQSERRFLLCVMSIQTVILKVIADRLRAERKQ